MSLVYNQKRTVARCIKSACPSLVSPFHHVFHAGLAVLRRLNQTGYGYIRLALPNGWHGAALHDLADLRLKPVQHDAVAFVQPHVREKRAHCQHDTLEHTQARYAALSCGSEAQTCAVAFVQPHIIEKRAHDTLAHT